MAVQNALNSDATYRCNAVAVSQLHPQFVTATKQRMPPATAVTSKLSVTHCYSCSSVLRLLQAACLSILPSMLPSSTLQPNSIVHAPALTASMLQGYKAALQGALANANALPTTCSP